MQDKDSEILTEVTSVAKEEEKTGSKIPIPDREEIKSRAAASLMTGLKLFNEKFSTLSARAKTRVMNAVLALPLEGVPVYLKTEAEKESFFIGQKVISDRFLITYYYIEEELKAKKEAQQEEQKLSEEDNSDKKAVDKGETVE